MNLKQKKVNSLAGFVLLELVAVIVILAILSIVAFPRIINMSVMRIDMAAKKIQSDIRYAQSLAISTQRRTRVRFNPDNDWYRLQIRDQSDSNWINLADPLTGETFRVWFNTGDFQGIDLGVVIMDGRERNYLVFDKWGNPYRGNRLLRDKATIPIISGTEQRDIQVERNTGRVYIQ